MVVTNSVRLQSSDIASLALSSGYIGANTRTPGYGRGGSGLGFAPGTAPAAAARLGPGKFMSY